MKRYAIGIAAALALLGHQSALAQKDTGSANYMMVGCHDGVSGRNREHFVQGLCAGNIQAILYLGRANNVCPPSGVTMGQALRVVVAYIDQLPARLHEPFAELALEALQQAWPCRR